MGRLSEVSTSPIEIQQTGTDARASLAGDFDMHATFTVEPALERLVDEPDVARLTVDLSRVAFIDSTGLGVLVRLQSEAADRGVELALVPGPPEVQRIFATAGLEDSLPFVAPGD
jgi:anti-sigma B factor antagonist